jgi:hypothetical protein
MTDFKRRTPILSTGKQIKLFSNSLAIGRSLEVGESGAPNIFSCIERSLEEKAQVEISGSREEVKTTKSKRTGKSTSAILNPLRLTRDEILEVADFNIRLWMEPKDKVRTY